MKTLCWVVGVLLLPLACTVNAGTLANNTWQPANCGIKPTVPVIDGNSVNAFNKSVAAINNWQQQAKIYYECLIKEANADNNIIAESANREQTTYRQAVKAIGDSAEAAKKKLDKQ